MGYAISNGGNSWRAVSPEMGLMEGEVYSETMPEDPAPSEAEILAALSHAVQDHLDRTAGERGYSSLFAAISYLESMVPQWAAEARACRDWRDTVWVACYAIIADVQSKKQKVPTDKELIAALPKIKW